MSTYTRGTTWIAVAAAIQVFGHLTENAIVIVGTRIPFAAVLFVIGVGVVLWDVRKARRS